MDFNFDKEKFVQMDAVTNDHGVWDDPYEYYISESYANRPNAKKLLAYRLALGRFNRRVRRFREQAPGAS